MGRARRISKTVSDAALWKMLAHHMDFCGMTSHIKKNFDMLSRLSDIEDIYADEFPQLKDTPAFKYYTRRQLVREVVQSSRWWLARWATDHRVLEEHHRHMYEFFDKDAQALPERIRRNSGSQGILLRDDPDARYFMVVAPRGFGKTNSYLGVEAVRDIINWPKNKYLVTSWQVDYAFAVIRMLRGIIFNPAMELIYPELFSTDKETYTLRGGRIKKDEINIIPEPRETDKYDASSSMRKESTFDTSALTSEKTQRHYHGVLYDDLGVRKNTRTAESAEGINNYIDGLAGLREKNIGQTTHPFWYKGTGTYWYVPGPIDHMLETKACKFFIMPMTYQHNNKKYRLSKEFTDSEIESRKKEFGRFFKSQCYNEGMSREDIDLDLGFSHDKNVVTLSHDEAQYLWRNSVHLQICDPAYSRKNKKRGDGKSRFTVTEALVTEDTTYYYHVFQSPGEKNKRIRSINLYMAEKFDIDAFIMDAQAAAQHGLAQEVCELLCDEFRKIWTYAHASSPLTDTADKIDVANEILSDRVQEKQVVVAEFPPTFPVPNNSKLIASQLAGESPGYDIVDTVVYGEADINRDMPRHRFVSRMVNKRLIRENPERIHEALSVIHGIKEERPPTRRQKAERRKHRRKHA